jgi:hypothetical protein
MKVQRIVKILLFMAAYCGYIALLDAVLKSNGL